MERVIIIFSYLYLLIFLFSSILMPDIAMYFFLQVSSPSPLFLSDILISHAPPHCLNRLVSFAQELVRGFLCHKKLKYSFLL